MSDVAFLTGGTGFVGANLARTLLREGFSVRCLVRKNSDRRNLDGLRVDCLEGDLLDKAALEQGCQGARYVFHCAADYRIWAPDAKQMYHANVDGTVNLLDAAARGSCEKIVYCSSVAAIKPPHDRTPANEDSTYKSVDEVISDYKKSKYLAELAAFKAAVLGVPVVIVNPAAPIGPMDIKPTPTGKIVVDFLNGKIPSYIDTGLNVVDVRDVAEGHLLAARKGRVGERYILGGENMTLKQVLDALADATGLPGPRFKTPYAVAYAFGAVDTLRARVFGGEPVAPLDAVKMAKHFMWFDSSKAKTELGYAPSSAKKALADAAQWFLEQGYARPHMKQEHACC